MREQNKNYRVLLTKHSGVGASDRVEGWIPETFALRLENHWTQAFANIVERVGGGLARDVASGTGYKNFFLKELTGHVWQGTEAINFQMKLEFDADTDINKDVYDPIQKLIEWASPEASGMFITAPGPNLVSQSERLSLRIGHFIYFDSVIIPDMDITWHTMMHKSGKPIAADVELSLRTFYTLTRSDIRQLFTAGAGNDFYNADLTSSQPFSSFGALGAGIREAIRYANTGANTEIGQGVTGILDSFRGLTPGGGR